MALQAGHIEWILRELNARSLPSMPAQSAKQIALAQMEVEDELNEILKLMQAPPPPPADDGDEQKDDNVVPIVDDNGGGQAPEE
jgi:hypothetical protein